MGKLFELSICLMLISTMAYSQEDAPPPVKDTIKAVPASLVSLYYITNDYEQKLLERNTFSVK